MAHASAEIEIDVPRPEVFRAISDLALRQWLTAHFTSDFHLTRVESSGVGAGARFRLDLPIRAIWLDTSIVEIREPHRIIERGRGGRLNRIPTTTVWELSEAPGSLTRVRVSFWTEPSNPVDRMLEALTATSTCCARGWRETLKKLREQLESEAAASPRVIVAGGNAHATGIP